MATPDIFNSSLADQKVIFEQRNRAITDSTEVIEILGRSARVIAKIADTELAPLSNIYETINEASGAQEGGISLQRNIGDGFFSKVGKTRVGNQQSDYKAAIEKTTAFIQKLANIDLSSLPLTYQISGGPADHRLERATLEQPYNTRTFIQDALTHLQGIKL